MRQKGSGNAFRGSRCLAVPFLRMPLASERAFLLVRAAFERQLHAQRITFRLEPPRERETHRRLATQDFRTLSLVVCLDSLQRIKGVAAVEGPV